MSLILTVIKKLFPDINQILTQCKKKLTEFFPCNYERIGLFNIYFLLGINFSSKRQVLQSNPNVNEKIYIPISSLINNRIVTPVMGKGTPGVGSKVWD